MMLKNKADQNPLTWKPSTILDAIKIITALMTNKNSPRVKIVAGMERSTKTGFKKTLRMAKTTATTRAVEKPSILIPGKR